MRHSSSHGCLLRILTRSMPEAEKVENYQTIKMRTKMSNSNEKVLEYEETYARIPRQLVSDLLNEKLSPDELFIYLWLLLNANPHNGIVKTSYEEIVSDLSVQGKNAKNHINKKMLNLKRNRYLWYRKQQGRRSSFQVEINGYLLSSKSRKDISHRFENGLSKGQAEVDENSSKNGDEVRPECVETNNLSKSIQQKLETKSQGGTHNSEKNKDVVEQLIQKGEKFRRKAFFDLNEQRKYINLMLSKGITPKRILRTFEERLGSDYWRNQERLPDFKTVYSHIKNER